MPQHIAHLISAPLLLPASAISYAVSRRLHLMFPERALVEGAFPAFDVESYAEAGLCSLQQRIAPYGQRVTHWAGDDEEELPDSGSNVWYQVEWEGKQLDLLTMNWETGMSSSH